MVWPFGQWQPYEHVLCECVSCRLASACASHCTCRVCCIAHATVPRGTLLLHQPLLAPSHHTPSLLSAHFCSVVARRSGGCMHILDPTSHGPMCMKRVNHHSARNHKARCSIRPPVPLGSASQARRAVACHSLRMSSAMAARFMHHGPCSPDPCILPEGMPDRLSMHNRLSPPRMHGPRMLFGWWRPCGRWWLLSQWRPCGRWWRFSHWQPYEHVPCGCVSRCLATDCDVALYMPCLLHRACRARLRHARAIASAIARIVASHTPSLLRARSCSVVVLCRAVAGPCFSAGGGLAVGGGLSANGGLAAGGEWWPFSQWRPCGRWWPSANGGVTSMRRVRAVAWPMLFGCWRPCGRCGGFAANGGFAAGGGELNLLWANSTHTGTLTRPPQHMHSPWDAHSTLPVRVRWVCVHS